MSYQRMLMMANAGSGYATAGLYFHLDAMNNTGNGVIDTTATTWVDLIGNNNVALPTGIWSWQNNRLDRVSSTASNTKTQNNVFVSSGDYTIELVVFIGAENNNAWINLRTGNVGPYMQLIRYNAGLTLSERNDSNTYTAVFDVAPQSAEVIGTFTLSVGNGSVRGYKNGIEVAPRDALVVTDWSRPLQPLHIGTGWGADATGQGVPIGVYAVRIYERILSSSEIYGNAKADKIRYGLVY